MKEWIGQLWKHACNGNMLLIFNRHKAQTTLESLRNQQQLSTLRSTPSLVNFVPFSKTKAKKEGQCWLKESYVALWMNPLQIKTIT